MISRAKRIKMEEAARLNRIRFLKVLLPLIVEITASGRRAFAEKRIHSGSAPEGGKSGAWQSAPTPAPAGIPRSQCPPVTV
jgi:hypothetical protein